MVEEVLDVLEHPHVEAQLEAVEHRLAFLHDRVEHLLGADHTGGHCLVEFDALTPLAWIEFFVRALFLDEFPVVLAEETPLVGKEEREVLQVLGREWLHDLLLHEHPEY